MHTGSSFATQAGDAAGASGYALSLPYINIAISLAFSLCRDIQGPQNQVPFETFHLSRELLSAQ